MYLTAEEYNEITGRDADEATDRLIKKACQLLDYRIGYYEREDDGWKLDLDDLEDYQSDAVKSWVAWLVADLVDLKDRPSAGSIKLGRFQMSVPEDSPEVLQELVLADAVLVSAKMVNRKAWVSAR